MLAAATSLTVTAGAHRVHLSGRHATDGEGRLTFDVPHGSVLPRVVELNDELPTVVEVTDIAPVAMRQRLRAQLTIAGWLVRSSFDAAPAARSQGDPRFAQPGDVSLRFVPITARLVEPTGPERDIDGEQLAAVRPDPLAELEADLLCHLVDAHPDAVDRLARHIPPRRLFGVRAVLPLLLDRHGIVLRLEYARRDDEIRIAFDEPIRTAADAPAQMLRLLTGVRSCLHRTA